MLAILNSLNAHNFPIFQPILMILVSKFMVRRALFDKAYLSLGLLSPLKRQSQMLQTTNFTSFLNLKKKGMIFHENRLPAEDSYDISCLIWYFLKKQRNLKLSSAAKVAL